MNGNESIDQRANTLRQLIVRAGIYRAIFARAALFTGILSLVIAFGIYLNDETKFNIGRAIRAREFAAIWILVLFFSLGAFLFLLSREAKRAERAFPSAEFKLALHQIKAFPIIPAAFTGWFFTTGYLGAQELDLVVVWMVFYGLILLSTALFAPRGIIGLGWAFILTSLSVPVITNVIESYFSIDVPNVLMALCFGAYHLIYAAFNWTSHTKAATDATASS
jgi:hypothetical protein